MRESFRSPYLMDILVDKPCELILKIRVYPPTSLANHEWQIRIPIIAVVNHECT